jgi:S-ribosylhomocysteine lyase LuxS involved in autoinducer biosynthesis
LFIFHSSLLAPTYVIAAVIISVEGSILHNFDLRFHGIGDLLCHVSILLDEHMGL